MFRRIFIKTRWLHKYLGLALILYGMVMGTTGIIINHPEWIESLSIPSSLVPNQYQPHNWDRNTLAGMAIDPQNPDRYLAFGDEGIYESTDAGRSFHSYMAAGFPQAPYLRKSHAVLILTSPPQQHTTTLAATRAGLFMKRDDQNAWHRLSLGPVARGLENDSSKDDEVLSLLQNNNQITAVTRDGFFQAIANQSDLIFHPLNVGRATQLPEIKGREHAVRFLFDLHSGRILGLQGRLLFDTVGFIIVLLSVSAFYLWYYPKRIKHARKKGRSIHTSRHHRNLFRSVFHYHLKIGIWVAPMLLIIAFTGFFMRPPVIMIPARITVPAWWMPLQSPPDQWTGRIKHAAFDPAANEILVECTDGFWRGSADFTEPFQPTRIGLPVHIMGTTVLNYDQKYGLLAGSFSGIYNRNRINNLPKYTGTPSQIINQQLGPNPTLPDNPKHENNDSSTKKYLFRARNQAKHRAENRARNRADKTGHPPDKSTVVDTTTGKQAGNISTLRLGTHMVTGFFRTPQGDEYISTFRDGLIRLNNNNDNPVPSIKTHPTERFPMPEEIRAGYRMSLWKYAFELHNGRFLKDWIGSAYLVIPILGSLLFFLLTASGVFDWIYIQLVKTKS